MQHAIPHRRDSCLWQPAWFLHSNVNVHHWARWQRKAAGTLGGGGNAPSSTGGIFPALLIPAASVLCEPQPRLTDEQPIAGQRHPVLVDKPSSARAVVQMKEASSHSWEAWKWDQLSEADRSRAVWEQTCKPALPPDAPQWCGSRMSPNPNHLVDGFSA